MLTSTLIATGALVAAIVDRVVLARKKIVVLDLGEPVERGEFIDVPFRYVNHCPNLRGAWVEYWLKDENNPALVLSGKHRTLDLSPVGLNAEFLSFRKEYVTEGEWTLYVRVTHGDCRWNPFYRLFPLQSTVKKFLIFNKGVPHGE